MRELHMRCIKLCVCDYFRESTVCSVQLNVMMICSRNFLRNRNCATLLSAPYTLIVCKNHMGAFSASLEDAFSLLVPSPKQSKSKEANCMCAVEKIIMVKWPFMGNWILVSPFKMMRPNCSHQKKVILPAVAETTVADIFTAFKHAKIKIMS